MPAPRALRAGCHLLDLTCADPRLGTAPLRCLGTLRVERAEDGVVASGDLYRHGTEQPDSDPRAGIPVFARRRYHGYLRVTGLDARSADADVALAFELHRHHAPSNAWTREGPFTALLMWSAAPAGHPSAGDQLAGELVGPTGRPAGRIALGWLSPFLRRAIVEIARVPESEPPLANSAGLDWRACFREVGWDVAAVERDAELSEPAGGAWTVADLHAALRAGRDLIDLDAEWRYQLLCVRRLATGERGLMFDDTTGDSDAIPREGAAIASHWPIPDTEAWGTVRGMRFGAATDPYFRTALHEIGHAMSLHHGGANNLMTPTEQLGGTTFPQNVVWTHRSADRRRLRHLPDVWVRPGGDIPFGTGYDTAPALPDALASARRPERR